VGFLFLGGIKEVNSRQFKVESEEEEEEGKSFNAEGTEVGAQRSRRVFA
jgi:hypothetical protein